MNNYKIYSLNDPITNEIRYIGQTCQPLKTRLGEHLRKLKNKTYKVNWIKSLIGNNLKPIIVLIEENLSKEDCNDLEIKYIRLYKELNPKLTNMTDGGEGSIGYKHSEETLAKLKEIRNKNNTLENRQKISESTKLYWLNADEKRILENRNQPKAKKINQFDLNNNLIQTFSSLRQIERELGYFRFNILTNLKKESKHAYGFIWHYAEP